MSNRYPCECGDPGCPVHPGKGSCSNLAVTTLFRVDMDDKTGVRMCGGCRNDAIESGCFRDKNEPALHQGPV